MGEGGRGVGGCFSVFVCLSGDLGGVMRECEMGRKREG